MNWAPRVKPIKIRRLYRYAQLGIYDDMLLHDVGWKLYARCADIVTVNDVYRDGRVPCPQCKTQIARQKRRMKNLLVKIVDIRSSGRHGEKLLGRLERVIQNQHVILFKSGSDVTHHNNV